MSEADDEGVRAPMPRPASEKDTTRWRRPIPQRTSSTTRWRQLGLDVARALALVGIMGNHLLGGGTYAAQATSQLMSDYHAVIFAVLIGCGVQLELDAARRRQRSPLRNVLIRGAFLILLGLVLGTTIKHVAVILVTLGMLTVVAHFAARLRTPAFSVLATLTFLVGPLLTIYNRAHGWSPQLMNPEPRDFAHPLTSVTSLLVADPYPFLAWVIYALVGIAYVRWVVSRHANLLTVMGVSVVVFVAAKLVSAWLAASTPVVVSLTETVGYTGSYLNLVCSAAMSVFIIAACSYLVEIFPRGRALPAGSRARARTWVGNQLLPTFAAAGQLTLTWYVAHLLVSDPIIPILEALPPAWRYGDFGVWAIQILVVLVGSAWHRRHYRYGPLEALPRKVASSWGNQTR